MKGLELAHIKERGAVFIALALLTLLTLLPALLYFPMGDRLIHEYQFHCLASDVWRGDLYARWCMDANGGVGGPVFLYYFPLSYWIGSLLWPLIFAGVEVAHVMDVLMAIASFAGALTCFIWLRAFVGRGAALAGTGLFVLAPYHTELQLFRYAYAELWFLALLPLIFLQLHRVAQGRQHAWRWLALLVALGLLMHAPGMVIAGVGAAVYLGAAWLQATDKKIMTVRLGQAALAGVLGLAGSAFYWLPAQYYKRYTAERLAENHTPVDRYPEWTAQFTHGFDFGSTGMIYMNTVITGLLLIALGVAALRLCRRVRGQEEFTALRQEGARMAAVFAAGFFMYLPLLEPLWQQSLFLRQTIFPWRFQLLWLLPLAFMAALLMEAHRRGAARLRMGDAGVLLVFLVLLSFRMVYYINPLTGDAVALYRQSKYLQIYPFVPRWMSAADTSYEAATAQLEAPRVVTRNAAAEVQEWGAETIRLTINARSGNAITLRQLYFPAWQAVVNAGGKETPLPLAHDARGRITFSVPAGASEVTIRFRPYYTIWKDITGQEAHP